MGVENLSYLGNAVSFIEIYFGDQAVVGLFKGWLGLCFCILSFMFLSPVLLLGFIIIFVCLFGVEYSVINTFALLFFIEISFVLLPPPPKALFSCYQLLCVVSHQS